MTTIVGGVLMGEVIRPPEFARADASSKPSRRRRPNRWLRMVRNRIRAFRAGRYDVRLAALILAVLAVAWMLALAGAAFAVRAMLVLCFATLAGRARRVGVPARQAVRIRR
jgi:hypothetical protein